MKSALLIPLEFEDYFSALSNANAGALIKAIFSYQQNLEKPNFRSSLANAVWHLMQPILDKHLQKYSNRKTASAQNGKKGGRPKKPKNLEKSKLTKEQILLRIQCIQKELDKRVLNENKTTS